MGAATGARSAAATGLFLGGVAGGSGRRAVSWDGNVSGTKNQKINGLSRQTQSSKTCLLAFCTSLFWIPNN